MSSRHGNWSTHELIRLKRLFPRSSVKRISQLLGRTESSVRRQARTLFARERRAGAWEEAEIATLRYAYGAVDLESIAMILARSIDDVRRQLDVLRATQVEGPWSQAELALLKELFGSRNDADLGACLSRPVSEVKQKAREYCLAKNKGSTESGGVTSLPRWSVKELDTLRQQYPHKDNLELARILGRSATSVANKAHKLGLKKSSASLAEMGRRNVSIRYRQ